MKKEFIFVYVLFLMVLGTINLEAQVKIGENATPRKGTILDLKSTYKGGLLLPNIAIVDMKKIPEAFNVPPSEYLDLAGLIVWNTIEGSEGVYVWDGTKWRLVMEPPSCLPDTPAEVIGQGVFYAVGMTRLRVGPVSFVSGVTYVWEMPSYVTIVSSEGDPNPNESTGTITVDIASAYLPLPAGALKVRAKNSCGLSVNSATNTEAIHAYAFLGMSSECYSSNKACECIGGGTPMWYNDFIIGDDSNFRGRLSSIASYFSHTTYSWWANGTLNDNNAYYYTDPDDSKAWSKNTNAVEGVAMCVKY